MYTPQKFKIDDPDVIREFIREHSFGLLLSVDDGDIHDTHTPFILSDDGQQLFGHIARANHQWNSWMEGANVKVIFSGPHAYISPRYYESEFAVPTWNYTAVSISGRISVIQEAEAKLDFLETLTATHEASADPWAFDRSDQRYLKLLSGIVVFSVSIDSIEASFKLNQNKGMADQRKVVASLTERGCPFDQDVASLMKRNLTNATKSPSEGEGNPNPAPKGPRP